MSISFGLLLALAASGCGDGTAGSPADGASGSQVPAGNIVITHQDDGSLLATDLSGGFSLALPIGYQPITSDKVEPLTASDAAQTASGDATVSQGILAADEAHGAVFRASVKDWPGIDPHDMGLQSMIVQSSLDRLGAQLASIGEVNIGGNAAIRATATMPATSGTARGVWVIMFRKNRMYDFSITGESAPVADLDQALKTLYFAR